MNLKYKIGASLLCGVWVWTQQVNAQMFDDETVDKTSAWSVPNKTNAKTSWWGKNNQVSDTKKENVVNERETSKFISDKTSNNPPAKVDVVNPEDYVYKAMPRKLRPTLDGVKRGTSSIYPVTFGDTPKAEDEPLIFLFYKDFSVNKLLSGTVTCSVRFQILTTLDRKLNNLSVRLRWPEMETTLTFIDVAPNQMVHYDYTLLGEGCYSMDKIPNIIVNRCRVKGLSQKECAAKIRWLKK